MIWCVSVFVVGLAFTEKTAAWAWLVLPTGVAVASTVWE